MFNNENPYTLRTEIVEGITHYYVSFTDGQAVHRETEVSRLVYLEFRCFAKKERNLRRWDERHIEQSELSDETLYNQAVHKPKNLEETVFDNLWNKQIQMAIRQLPEIQRRRFILYYEYGLTYEQIAEMENCSKVAVKYTIDKARTIILKKFESFSE